MSGQYCYKNNEYYTISNRTYLDDYSYIEHRKINMVLSGSYLAKYPFKRIRKYKFDRYPSSKESENLINNIKRKYEFYNQDYKIILGAGANGLIQNLCKILVKENDNILVPYLSFDQIEYAATSYSAYTKRIYLNSDFSINLDYFESSIDEKTKIIYICNPNNPTGTIIDNNIILGFAKKHPDIYIIIDESNIEFSNQNSLIKEKLVPNVIVLESFSKVYGLSNLRIGYMVCHKDFEKIYKKNITTNEITGISLYFANCSICSNKYKNNIEKIRHEIEYLTNELENIGIEVYNTYSNTIFTKTTFSNEFLDILKNNNISLLPINDQNDKLHFRIACQNHKTNKKFINTLKKTYNV